MVISSDLLLQHDDGPLARTKEIRRAVRRLRWFLQSFDNQLAAVEARTGNQFQTDRKRLTECFVAWLRLFESQQPEGRRDRKEFTYFCAGLMLSELVRRQPIEILSVGADLEATDPAAFWPEGYVYVAYCLNVAAAVLDQEFDHQTQLHPTVRDIEAWWSFKENAREMPSMAIPFLDLFMGLRPSWEAPGLFSARSHFKDKSLPPSGALSKPGSPTPH